MGDRHYEDAIRGEVERWPGASVTFSSRSRHDQATLAFGGSSRFVVIPSTPGDSRRGTANSISDVRRELQRLGAMRMIDPPRSGTPRRKVAPVVRDKFAHIERAPRRENPFEALAALHRPAPRPIGWVAALAVLAAHALINFTRRTA